MGCAAKGAEGAAGKDEEGRVRPLLEVLEDDATTVADGSSYSSSEPGERARFLLRFGAISRISQMAVVFGVGVEAWRKEERGR